MEAAEAIAAFVLEMAMKIVNLFAAGDKEKERQVLLAIARQSMDEAAKRELA